MHVMPVLCGMPIYVCLVATCLCLKPALTHPPLQRTRRRPWRVVPRRRPHALSPLHPGGPACRRRGHDDFMLPHEELDVPAG
jgi:hypothetical protein